MSEKKLVIPKDFRNAQKKSGVAFDEQDFFLDEIQPMNTAQERLVSQLSSLLEIIQEADRERKRGMTRVLLVCGAEGRGKTLLCESAINMHLRRLYNNEIQKDSPMIADALKNKAMYLTHFELDLLDKSCMNPKASRTQYEQYEWVSGKIEFLVIDEIGRGSWSDYSSQNIENIISKRYANCLPTVLITNKTARELSEMFDKSTRDRLMNGTTGVMVDMDQGKSISLR